MPHFAIASVLPLIVLLATSTDAQWLKYPTPGIPRSASGLLTIIQTPRSVAMLYEVPNNFRQILTDGRELPRDPNPTWQGYSVGRWDGDTLVVDTIGFNDRSMIGRPPYPHSEGLRLSERYRRRDFGHIDLHMTVNDDVRRTSWFAHGVHLEPAG